MSMIEKIKSSLGLVSKSELVTIKAELETVKKASSWERYFGRGTEGLLFGESVTRPYEQIPSVYKAVKAIADNVPQADLKFRDRKSGKDIDNDEIINLFNNPNPYMTESDLIQAWVGFASLYGEAMVVKEISTVGQATGRQLPSELWVFNPSDFKEITVGRVIQGWRYTKEQILFQPNQVIFIKDFNPYNMFRGLDPKKPIEKIIDIDWQSLVYNKAFFDNDATPGFVLGTDEELGDDVIKRTKAAWDKKHRGASKSHEIAILEAGLKPMTTGANHKDMEFMEQKRFSREEILGIWRAPKALFNITDDLNYATFNGQMKIFWSYSIMPVMKKVEAAINKYIVWPYNDKIEAYFDYSNVVAYQEDFKEKVVTAEQLSRIGFTRNEINGRLQLGFDEVPWGDAWWASFGLTPITSAEKEEPELDPEPEPEPDPEPPKEEPKKSADEQRRAGLWKGFLFRQGGVESKMSGAISKYFFEQRKDSLAALNDLGAEGFKIDWDEQDKKLKDKAEKWLFLAAKQGVEFGRSILGKKSLSDDQLDAQISSFLVLRTDKITAINETIRKQLKNILEQSIANGDTIMQISNKFREVYNLASTRSLMIARTETVGALNGGSQIYYESEGVQKKEWLTARDNEVRGSHMAVDGQVVAVNSSFSNGLDYPGDQKGDAGDVINCRCTLLPVIE